MFNLEPCVHLKEIEILISTDDKLHRSRRTIANGLGQFHRLLAHGGTGFIADKGAWCLLKNLLVPPLHGTFTFTDIDDVTMGISQNLNFDMARAGDKFFHENAAVTK